MPATIHPVPVSQPEPAPALVPEMNARDLEEFRAAVQALRAERALEDHTAAAIAAIASFTPSQYADMARIRAATAHLRTASAP